jgi:outer membrane scaffolding protein for murein synthesis (MipA/OmpV family)
MNRTVQFIFNAAVAGSRPPWSSPHVGSQTFFGIDALQAQRSAYAQYTPEGGVALIGFSVGAAYELTSHWSVGARAAAERLQGDAARSPIVANKNQNIYALFAFYGF